MIKNKSYRRIYIKHKGKIPIDENGVTFDIHHIDGDRANNSPDNLVALSVADHLKLHQAQGDVGAVFLLSRRTPNQDISEISKLTQKKRIHDGTHNFQLPNFQKNAQKKLIAEGKHLSQTDPEKHRKIAKLGGKKAGKIIKERGWTNEQISRRVETRKSTVGFSQDMSKCHTKEAIEKRASKRRGVPTNCSHLKDPLTLFTRQKTKVLKKMNEISKTYNEPVTENLLLRATRERKFYLKWETVIKYAAEHIALSLCGGPQVKTDQTHHGELQSGSVDYTIQK